MDVQREGDRSCVLRWVGTGVLPPVEYLFLDAVDKYEPTWCWCFFEELQFEARESV